MRRSDGLVRSLGHDILANLRNRRTRRTCFALGSLRRGFQFLYHILLFAFVELRFKRVVRRHSLNQRLKRGLNQPLYFRLCCFF
jgi:hypothetical protein